jgi:hypothetical protein
VKYAITASISEFILKITGDPLVPPTVALVNNGCIIFLKKSKLGTPDTLSEFRSVEGARFD